MKTLSRIRLFDLINTEGDEEIDHLLISINQPHNYPTKPQQGAFFMPKIKEEKNNDRT